MKRGIDVMDKKRVVILFGGCSTEYEVSLQSACCIIRNLDPCKYTPVLIGITRDGRWYRYYGDVERISDNTWHTNKSECVPVMFSPDRCTCKIIELKDGLAKISKIDIVFPVLHGKNGEDGTVQGLLELAGIPLVGCDTLSSALCMDKVKAHKLVAMTGIKVPPSVTLNRRLTEREITDIVSCLHYPLFVKPVRSGSSYGITKVFEKRELYDAVINAFKHDEQVIVEENIEGFEVGCAVLGNDDLILSEVDEIELADGFFNYTEKYTLRTSKIHVPARVDSMTANRIKKAAAVIYKTLGCRGFARVDMFLTPDKEIYFSEVNTIPGFTPHSRYLNMMKATGLQLPDILNRLIQLGFEK